MEPNETINTFEKANMRLIHSMKAARKAILEYNKAYDSLPDDIKELLKEPDRCSSKSNRVIGVYMQPNEDKGI